ncbi:mental retardation GTPase activating protein [Salix suchowensis]|nr:mental retardation GTPase activating protein [Salix suchowensis]
MASIMDQQSPYTTFQRRDEPEFNLREWAFRAQLSGENTTISRSRRFSGSNIRSFGEDARSFRSNITISSTASSPGYSLRDEIDPSTYSFTAALRALQARSGYYNIWECSSPDGFALNSKWNEAEKYIRNPLSGEVPMECLSAKTLSGRSFRNLTNRITMSAPLVYSNHRSRQIQTKTTTSTATNDDIVNHFPIKEDKMEGKLSTRDVGTQSTPPDVSSSSSPCPAAPTPPIREGKRCEVEDEDSPNCNSKMEARVQVEVKETRGKEESTKNESRNGEQMWSCSIGKLGGASQ